MLKYYVFLLNFRLDFYVIEMFVGYELHFFRCSQSFRCGTSWLAHVPLINVANVVFMIASLQKIDASTGWARLKYIYVYIYKEVPGDGIENYSGHVVFQACFAFLLALSCAGPCFHLTWCLFFLFITFHRIICFVHFASISSIDLGSMSSFCTVGCSWNNSTAHRYPVSDFITDFEPILVREVSRNRHKRWSCISLGHSFWCSRNTAVGEWETNAGNKVRVIHLPVVLLPLQLTLHWCNITKMKIEERLWAACCHDVWVGDVRSAFRNRTDQNPRHSSCVKF